MPRPDARRDFRARAEQVRAGNQLFPPVASAPAGPVERGERLGTITRGESEELRVTWDSYNGREFLSVRLWTRSTAGAWFPDKTKGITIRRHELAPFADAFAEALDRADAAPPPADA